MKKALNFYCLGFRNSISYCNSKIQLLFCNTNLPTCKHVLQSNWKIWTIARQYNILEIHELTWLINGIRDTSHFPCVALRFRFDWQVNGISNTTDIAVMKKEFKWCLKLIITFLIVRHTLNITILQIFDQNLNRLL